MLTSTPVFIMGAILSRKASYHRMRQLIGWATATSTNQTGAGWIVPRRVVRDVAHRWRTCPMIQLQCSDWAGRLFEICDGVLGIMSNPGNMTSRLFNPHLWISKNIYEHWDFFQSIHDYWKMKYEYWKIFMNIGFFLKVFMNIEKLIINIEKSFMTIGKWKWILINELQKLNKHLWKLKSQWYFSIFFSICNWFFNIHKWFFNMIISEYWKIIMNIGK